MTEDNPGWRVFFNLLKCLYHNHPVKIDIAGTVESIAKIDADLLYKCYGTFYNLHNMVLSIAGNVKTDEVIKIADELLIPTKDKKLETVFEEEPYGIVQKEVVQKMPVGTPIFHIGFKSNALIGYEGLKAEMEAYVAVNVIADAFSELYKELMDDGLVNNSFSTEVFNGDGYFTVIFAGESKDPREVLNRIKMAINKAKKDGLNREHFDVIKKATYGSTIREFNNVDSVANLLINNYFSNLSPFDGVKILSQMTYEDVQSCLIERFDTENVAISIIES
jgi:predicted Zn-dependent peptidase